MNLTNLFLPLSFGLSVVTYTLIAIWYIMPTLGKIPRANALTLLILFHTIRHVGTAFLLPGVTAETLDLRFANPAAYGDLLAAVLAFIAIAGLRLKWPIAIPLVWTFNLVGTIDLFHAVFQGLRFHGNGDMGAMYLLVALVVPAILVTHIMVFVLLLKPQRQAV